MRFFGKKLEDLMKYDTEIKKLPKTVEESGFSRYYTYSGMYPDLFVKKNNMVYFIYAIVNQAGPKKYIKDSVRIAEEHGFEAPAPKSNTKL